MSGEGTLDLSLLPSAGSAPAPVLEEGDASLKQRVEAYERGLIVAALAAAGGHRTEAARALGVGRATLHEKMTKYGLRGGE